MPASRNSATRPRRRMAGDLTEDQFKPLRLQERALPPAPRLHAARRGALWHAESGAQMRMLGDIADKYDRGYGHFTTRQNIQYNWIKLEDAPDILADLATVEMHAIQTSGNCIRNISSDQYAGAAADEMVDPRPYAELLRQWSSFHPEFTDLPRKFKIAVIASETDRAAMKLHDIGIRIVRNEAGEIGAAFYVGGGMGRTPMIAPLVNGFVPLDQLITYSEACLRVYNRYGRRDNKYKARIKILVHELGKDEYTRQVEEEFAHMLDARASSRRLAELERISAYVRRSGVRSRRCRDELDRSDPDFALWVDQQQRMPHKQPGYIIATISLKPIGGIPGDASADQIRLMADLAERLFSFDELRVTHAQNIVLPHVRKADLYALWQELDAAGLADRQPRSGQRHHRLPGPRLLQPRQCPLDPGRAEDRRALRRPRPPARTRRAQAQDLGLHQRLRPSPRRPHRHPRGRSQGRRELPAAARRQRRRGYLARQDHRPRLRRGRHRRCGRKGHRRLSRAARRASERFLDTYRRIGMTPFKEAIYG